MTHEVAHADYHGHDPQAEMTTSLLLMSGLHRWLWPRSSCRTKGVRSCIQKFRCTDGTWLGPRANGCVRAGGRCVPVDLTNKMRHLTQRWSMTDRQPPEEYIQTRQHRSYLTPSRPNHTPIGWRRAHVARTPHALRTPLACRATAHGTVHMSSWCICVVAAARHRGKALQIRGDAFHHCRCAENFAAL